MAMTKTEIIVKTVSNSACLRSAFDDVSSEGNGYTEEEIVATLQASLAEASPDELVRTCADFSDVQAKCCESCHDSYPHLELALIDIESGGHAWICCALDRALNPEKQVERESSPEWKGISKMFDGNVVDRELLLRNGLSD